MKDTPFGFQMPSTFIKIKRVKTEKNKRTEKEDKIQMTWTLSLRWPWKSEYDRDTDKNARQQSFGGGVSMQAKNNKIWELKIFQAKHQKLALANFIHLHFERLDSCTISIKTKSNPPQTNIHTVHIVVRIRRRFLFFFSLLIRMLETFVRKKRWMKPKLFFSRQSNAWRAMRKSVENESTQNEI